MKTHIQHLINSFLFTGIIFLTFFSVNAQARFAPLDASSVIYTISNVVVVSDRILEFDLYLKDTDPAQPFELSIIQAGILVNSDIINGGNITTSVVPGFSDLIPAQQPTTAIWAKGPTTSAIKITPKIGPGPGNGTIIKSKGQGTRICRVRITNSVPFAKAKPNLTFCFTPVPYPTKVFQYIERVSTQLTTNPENCLNEATNPLLNEK